MRGQPLEDRYELPNVAAVPQFSPFRYPGGKSRWYNIIRAWVECARPDRFVEPFAGGAHAGLAVAIENLADEVILVEKDGDVAAVWKTIIDGDVEWLINRIRNLELTRGQAKKIVAQSGRSDKDRALATIVRNRVSRGGITAPGSGWLKNGENDNGMDSRWYPSTLADRIKTIAEVRDRIQFSQGNAFDIIPECQDEGSALFIDPPYPKSGERLYEHADIQHEEVFRLAHEAKGTVLLTYDDSGEIVRLAEKYGFATEELVVSTAHHQKKTELLIGDDLRWLVNVKQSA